MGCKVSSSVSAVAVAVPATKHGVADGWTHSLSSNENVVTLSTRMAKCGVESGMLMVWLLVMLVLMRSCVMLV